MPGRLQVRLFASDSLADCDWFATFETEVANLGRPAMGEWVAVAFMEGAPVVMNLVTKGSKNA
ncbi:hypothetical protein [Nakamurella leprariae]|uniref:Uncharacterized protein n=1 Tax=Nakamurella leprariae TaxID=2803911 RepID=A0A938Y8U7_9ACTN|nr:hypothetical protein [Nakamurella leprariae]MBM9466097.1 hypothetical protein [Nakamurella leprariae]